VSTTEAQADVMRQTATRFDNVNADLQRMLNQLMGELEGLQSAWQGRGGRMFAHVKQEWSADQRALNSALADTAQAIRAAAGAYASSDDTAAGAIAAAAGGTSRILPL
jgi:WXG100 family type VII secretion target